MDIQNTNFLENVTSHPLMTTGLISLLCVYTIIKIMTKTSSTKDELIKSSDAEKDKIIQMLLNKALEKEVVKINPCTEDTKEWIRRIEDNLNRLEDKHGELEKEVAYIKPILGQIRKKVLNGHDKH